MIMTFGSSEEQSQIYRIAKLGLLLKDGQTRPLTLFVLPFICEPLTCQQVFFCWNNFNDIKDLDLTDPSYGSSRLDVDILIGSNQYWQLVADETRHGNPGPVAINTVLGWVLSGPVPSTTPDVSSIFLVTRTLCVEGLPQDMQFLDN